MTSREGSPELQATSDLLRASALSLYKEASVAPSQEGAVWIGFNSDTGEASFTLAEPLRLIPQQMRTFATNSGQSNKHVVKLATLGSKGVIVTNEHTRPAIEEEGFGAVVRTCTAYELAPDKLPLRLRQQWMGRLTTAQVCEYGRPISQGPRVVPPVEEIDNLLETMGYIREMMIHRQPPAPPRQPGLVDRFVRKWLGQ